MDIEDTDNYDKDYEEEYEEEYEEQEEISPEEQAILDEEEYQYNMSIVRKHSNKTDNISLFNVKAVAPKKIQEFKPKINKNADKIIKLDPSVKPETRQFNPRLPVPNKYNLNHKKKFKLNDTDFPTL
jgi:hypothetical protein